MTRLAPVTLFLAGASLAVALAGCGKQADLVRPAPMFGSPQQKADYAAQKRAQAANADRASESNETIAPQNPALKPYTDPAPAHDVPIPGEPTYPSGRPDPTGAGPQ
jgi:hypothetical protein